MISTFVVPSSSPLPCSSKIHKHSHTWNVSPGFNSNNFLSLIFSFLPS
nr:MAG TPA: hypothetical protein [Bacteriophage sp.]